MTTTSSIAETLRRLRPSIVTIVAGGVRGTGFFALDNGVIVTTQGVVGYERRVTLLLDDGREIDAAVLRVNVALDVALVLPDLAALGALPPPLAAAAEPPEVGGTALAVARVDGVPMVAATVFTAVDRKIGGHLHLQLGTDVEPALRGAPVVDDQGLVRGVLTKTGSPSEVLRQALVLPTYGYDGGLGSVDLPVGELAGITPEYGCPRCDTIFEPKHERCLECGELLPHGLVEHAPLRAGPTAAGLAAVLAALASLGVIANRVRVGVHRWCVPRSSDGKSGDIVVSLDGASRNLLLRVPICGVVAEGHEGFYRFLLTLNDDSLDDLYLALYGDSAWLVASLPIERAATRVGAVVANLDHTASHLRALLETEFGAEPRLAASLQELAEPAR